MTKYYIIPTTYSFKRHLSLYDNLLTIFGYKSLASGHERKNIRRDLLSVFNLMSGLKVDTKLSKKIILERLHGNDNGIVLTTNINDARKYCYKSAYTNPVTYGTGISHSFAIYECSLEEEEAQLVEEIKSDDEIRYKLEKPLLGITDKKEFFKKIKLENAELINIIDSFKPPLRYEFPKRSLWRKFKDFIYNASTRFSGWFKSLKTHGSSRNTDNNAPESAPYPTMLFNKELCPSDEHASDRPYPSGEHTSDGSCQSDERTPSLDAIRRQSPATTIQDAKQELDSANPKEPYKSEPLPGPKGRK